MSSKLIKKHQRPKQAFTTYSKRIELLLINEVFVCADFDEQEPLPTNKKYRALWDTGATGSAITQRVIDELQLEATGRGMVHGTAGSKASDIFRIALFLPGEVLVHGIEASNVEIKKELHVDVLIGMDVISLGDFAISNEGDATSFTFRIPPLKRIDFLQGTHKSLRKKW